MTGVRERLEKDLLRMVSRLRPTPEAEPEEVSGASVVRYADEGDERAAERAGDVMSALAELACEATLVPTSHPVVDIVRFQRLTCDLAEARGIDPDLIRWDEDPWDRARRSYS